MKIKHVDRQRIGLMIRNQLPWADVIIGAPRYSFIAIGRGETVTGSYNNPNRKTQAWQGSAWSFTPPGAYEIEVDFQAESIELHRYMEPSEKETERKLVCKKWPLPRLPKNADWRKMLADHLVTLAVQHIPALPPESVKLRAHEKFEIRQCGV